MQTLLAKPQQSTSTPQVPGGATTPVRSATLPREYLSFRLGQEEYGIDIQHVREIRSFEQPMRIPNAPHAVKGVVNLRGVIVPVVDLRLKLGYASADYKDRTVIIVVNVRDRILGAIVDSVSDVLAFGADNIKPAPPLKSAGDARHIIGIGHMKAGEEERMLILSDIEALMSSSLMERSDAMAH